MEPKESIQVVQPEISKRKFKREVEKFKRVEKKYRKKGVLLLDYEFPIVVLAFAVPKLKPTPPIAFAVKLDFTNYDLEPPSITFIDPFNGDVLKRGEINIGFLQINKPEKANPQVPIQQQIQTQDLLQGNPDSIPFFCIPGVREYHNHPYHSGDSWFLYRVKREGELITLVNQLYDYSFPYIKGFKVNLNPEIGGYQIAVNKNDLD